MTHDATTVCEFLSERPPFDQLPAAALEQLAANAVARNVSRGTALASVGDPVSSVWVIASGAVDVEDASGKALATLRKGALFGHDELSSQAGSSVSARAARDTVLYELPASEFERLSQGYPGFRLGLGVEPAAAADDNAPAEAATLDPQVNVLHVPVADILTRAAVEVAPETSILDAARAMRRERISSLLVVEDGRLIGLVTDRDLRNRVIAEGRSTDLGVREIMSPSPASIDIRSSAHEALIEMLRTRYHHLPVLDGTRAVGMLTDTDLLRRHSASPLFLIADVHRANDVEALVAASRRVRPLHAMLVTGSAGFASIGRTLSAVGEAIVSRLLLLAEREFGPSPVPFAWLTGGSLARFELTSHSDQDNCLLLDDAYDERRHGEYFERLAGFVCDALDACGYVYCPGDVMASNARWRQPLKVWKQYFRDWIEQPEPSAQMHASIFFDLRLVHGDTALFAELEDYVRPRAASNRIFLAFMTSNALKHEPPLGFFGNFVLVSDGEHDRTLDLKHSGVIPIVDLARLSALAGGVKEVNTLERLDAAVAAGTLSAAGSADLRDAMIFIGSLRMRHEASRIRAGLAPNNFVPPSALSHLERRQLKDAFAVVRSMQSALGNRYQATRLR